MAGVAARGLRALGVAAAIAAVWEAAKALFAIPTWKLPHLHEIAGDFLRRTGNDELYGAIAFLERVAWPWRPDRATR